MALQLPEAYVPLANAFLPALRSGEVVVDIVSEDAPMEGVGPDGSRFVNLGYLNESLQSPFGVYIPRGYRSAEARPAEETRDTARYRYTSVPLTDYVVRAEMV